MTTSNIVSRTPSTISVDARGNETYKNNTTSAGITTTKSYKLNNDKNGNQDMVFVRLFWITFILLTILVTFGDWLLLPKNALDWCHAAQLSASQGYNVIKQYPNPDAITNPCYYERTIYLLGWNQFECDFARRMIYATILGACIGFERKSSDRPAGVRTMSLVSLGAAIFTLGGQFAFRSSTQEWDAARVSAAIPSGVGFLAGALIWKETTGEKVNQRNHVHGITTAASVWLSASVGIAAGGALWVCSAWTVILVVFVLRFGPKFAFVDDVSYKTSDQSLTTADEGLDWNDDNESEADSTCKTSLGFNAEQPKDSSLETSEMKEYRGDKSVRPGLESRSSKRHLIAPTDISIRQVEKQQVNFHSD